MARRQPDIVRAEREEKRLLETWEHPEGTDVIVTRDLGEQQASKTRSKPWMLCGSAVVLLEGISGGFLLSRVRVQTAPQRALLAYLRNQQALAGAANLERWAQVKAATPGASELAALAGLALGWWHQASLAQPATFVPLRDWGTWPKPQAGEPRRPVSRA